MKSHIGSVLGAKLGRDETKLWGTGLGEDPQKVRLLSIPPRGRRAKLFDQVIKSALPPTPARGGCVLNNDLVTPEGERFAVLTFHGDVPGWQRQIEEGAASLGLITAKIRDGRLELSDGRMVPVADCRLEGI